MATVSELDCWRAAGERGSSYQPTLVGLMIGVVKGVYEDLCWCTSSGRPQSAHRTLIELWINSEPGAIVWSAFV
jgi:hypothetical protein